MRVKAIKFNQGRHELYLFSAPAAQLWDSVEINKRTDDKVEGYQRALSPSRANDVRKFVEAGNVIAPAIVLSFDSDKVHFDERTNEIVTDGSSDAGWVIDGQHRLRGAQLASEASDVNLPAVAFIGLDLDKQIQQFVTINKEAKGVPTSLYYDLLDSLPPSKKPSLVAKEKAAAIANSLRRDQDSIFFDRIVVVTAPKKGELSLNNFVRKVSPLLVESKGSLSAFSQKEVSMIIENYFKALKSVFPEQFSSAKSRFFQTLGFGAMINALYPVFSITYRQTGGFRVEDAERMLSKASDFNFDDWDRSGTGSSAEIQAGRDFETHFKAKVQDSGDSTILRLT